MSGRYTFVAGTNGTASQMNSYVMDGILYKQQIGTYTVPMTGGTPWSSGSVNITGVLSGFTQTPYIFVSGDSAQGTGLVSAHVNVTSTSAFTIYAFYYGNSSSARLIRWNAIQATSTTASGS
jgi:hypothetical protein